MCHHNPGLGGSGSGRIWWEEKKVERIHISYIFAGSSLHAWDLTQRLTSYTSGLQTIDSDLAYLYGQLPSKIRDAANAVMDKAERKVQTDVFVAGINVLGTAFG